MTRMWLIPLVSSGNFGSGPLSFRTTAMPQLFTRFRVPSSTKDGLTRGMMNAAAERDPGRAERGARPSRSLPNRRFREERRRHGEDSASWFTGAHDVDGSETILAGR
jgi:hypothetical protein